VIDVTLDWVIASSSALTASCLVYIAREAREVHRTISANEERSTVNRAVLRREGMLSPVHDRPRDEGDS